jgi:hypothetical protein
VPEQRIVTHNEKNDKIYYVIKGHFKVQGWALQRRKRIMYFREEREQNKVVVDESQAF